MYVNYMKFNATFYIELIFEYCYGNTYKNYDNYFLYSALKINCTNHVVGFSLFYDKSKSSQIVNHKLQKKCYTTNQ